MALINTAWLMGSEPDVPETTISVTANAVTEDIVLPGGNLYPWDGNAANSALNQLHDALESHSEISSCTALIGRDRLPRFTCDISYAIDSWSDLTFRNLLGFAGGEAFAGTTQTPSGFSDYLWSPGRCEIPDAPLGHPGLPYHDTAVGMSGDAVVIATTNNSGAKNRFRFSYVRAGRVMTASQLPGEYERFWDTVVRRFYRWKLYREVTEEDTAADGTDAALVSTDVLGPYKLLRAAGLMELTYQREIENVELFSPVEIPALLVGDY